MKRPGRLLREAEIPIFLFRLCGYLTTSLWAMPLKPYRLWLGCGTSTQRSATRRGPRRFSARSTSSGSDFRSDSCKTRSSEGSSVESNRIGPRAVEGDGQYRQAGRAATDREGLVV